MTTLPLNDVMDQINDLTQKFWEHFGLEGSMFYNISDMRDCFWDQGSREFSWWSADELQDAKDESGSDDPDDWDRMYSGHIYGTSVWTTPEFTVAVLDNGCGDRDAYLFANKNRIQRT